MADQALDDSLINLARQPAFRIGLVEVRPAMRQIVRDGTSETVEPRVLQVLVALAEARGRIIGHDELIARCWAGRVIGENAIHRVVSRIRELAATIGGGSFEIETVRGVGYRLTERPSTPDKADAAGTASRPRRQWAAAAATLLALLAASALALRWLAEDPPAPTISLEAAPGSSGGELVRGLKAELARLAGARAASLSFVEEPQSATPDYRVALVLERLGGVDRVDLSLSVREGANVVWASSLERPSSEFPGLRRQVAARLGKVLLCATGPFGGLRRKDSTSLRLFLASCELADEAPSQGRLGILRQLSARQPGSALAWAQLALTEAQLADVEAVGASELDARSLRVAAADHLRRARELDPAIGEIFAAEAELLDRRRTIERLAVVERGLAILPEAALLHRHRASYLAAVGRGKEAVASAQRAVALDPLSAEARSTLIAHLAYGGRFPEARRELAAGEGLWPGSYAMRDARFRFHWRYGDVAEARRMIQAGEVRPPGRFGDLFLEARAQPTNENVRRMADAGWAQLQRGSESVPIFIQALGQFGLIDDVFRLLDQPGALDRLAEATEILFRSNMRGLWTDRRFLELVDRLGLVRYWRQTGAWPDFCFASELPYDCDAGRDTP